MLAGEKGRMVAKFEAKTVVDANCHDVVIRATVESCKGHSHVIFAGLKAQGLKFDCRHFGFRRNQSKSAGHEGYEAESKA